MASICKLCVCEPCACELPPPPTLMRLTNQVGPREPDEHDGCENEPCAYCLRGWINDLEVIKIGTMCEPIKTYQIRYHEKMIAAGYLRLARETLEFPLPTTEFTRQTNDHPINFQPPCHQCLVKNCQVCLEAGPGLGHLLTKEERDEL